MCNTIVPIIPIGKRLENMLLCSCEYSLEKSNSPIVVNVFDL